MSLVLALDFGGTKHAAATWRPGDSELQAVERQVAPAGATAADDLSVMATLIDRVLAGARPTAVGVAFGGPVWADRGIVRRSHHVEGWSERPLDADVRRLVGPVPVLVENDGIAGAYAEHRFGAGRGHPSLLYVTVSTGVGGGIVLDGRVWRGRSGMAGHVGHIRIDPEGPACVCGGRGCVESLAAGPYLAARARTLVAARPTEGAALRERCDGDLGRLTAADVGALAPFDPLAAAVLAAAGRAVGVGIGSACNVIDPERVVVGGGVAKAGDGFWRPLLEAARATAMPEVRLEIVRSELGDTAPLWGAAALALERFPTGVAPSIQEERR